jgi:hypothetical protein
MVYIIAYVQLQYISYSNKNVDMSTDFSPEDEQRGDRCRNNLKKLLINVSLNLSKAEKY